MKYLGINFTKEVPNVYSEKYKTSLKEIKEDLTKLKDTPVHRLKYLILLGWQYSPNCSIYSTQSISQFQLAFFFLRNPQVDLRINKELGGTQINQNNLQKEQGWRIHNS